MDGSRPSAPVLVAPEGMQLAGRALARKPGVGDVPRARPLAGARPAARGHIGGGRPPEWRHRPGRGGADARRLRPCGGAFHLVAMGGDNTRLTSCCAVRPSWPRGAAGSRASRRRLGDTVSASRSRPLSSCSCTCSSSNDRPQRGACARGRVQRLRSGKSVGPTRAHREPRRLGREVGSWDAPRWLTPAAPRGTDAAGSVSDGLPARSGPANWIVFTRSAQSGQSGSWQSTWPARESHNLRAANGSTSIRHGSAGLASAIPFTRIPPSRSGTDGWGRRSTRRSDGGCLRRLGE